MHYYTQNHSKAFQLVKSGLILFSLFWASFMTAQITIDESITPTIGETWAVKYMEAGTFNQGPAGADQTWDFSGLDISSAFDLDFEILDPADVLGNENFPGAEFVWYIPGFEIYEFYQSNADSITLLGGVSISDNAIDFMTVYTDPEDAIQLPLEYEKSYPYTSAFDQYLFGNFIASGDRTGQFEVDGYGTIITPSGTYEDVLRVKITETSFGLTSTQYAWMDAQNFVPIMVFESSEDPEETPSVYYSIPSVVNNTKNQIISQWQQFSVSTTEGNFPINIQLESDKAIDAYSWQLFTIDGKEISNTAINGIQKGQNQFTLHGTSNYCGMAIVHLNSAESIATKQIWLCPKP